MPTTTSGSTSQRSGDRWERTPPLGLRLFSAMGPPALTVVVFLLAWSEVSHWPETPTGDTNFLWMPAALPIPVVCCLVGLAAWGLNTATGVLEAAP